MKTRLKQQIRGAMMRLMDKEAPSPVVKVEIFGNDVTLVEKLEKRDWESISDSQWMRLAKQFGFYCGEWQTAETNTYQMLHILMNDARRQGSFYLITAGGGAGKTHAASRYARQSADVWYLCGSGSMSRKDLLREILLLAGLDTDGELNELLKRIQVFFEEGNEPLVVIDNAHRLKDRVVLFVGAIAERLAGTAGVVLMGAEELRRRIVDHACADRAGFRSFYLRNRKRFVSMAPTGTCDVELVCAANGVTAAGDMATIYAESKGDLHRAVAMIAEMRNLASAA